MSHLFLDIESLDLRATAVITEIAAVEFDPIDFAIGRTLSLDLCADSQVMRGRTIDPDTVKWHEDQGHVIKMSFALDLELALSSLEDWIGAVAPERVWIWGSDFDLRLLTHAWESVDLKQPWDYYNTMDARTLWNVAFPATKRPKRPHAALGDCLASIDDVRTALTKLNLAGESQDF